MIILDRGWWIVRAIEAELEELKYLSQKKPFESLWSHLSSLHFGQIMALCLFLPNSPWCLCSLLGERADRWQQLERCSYSVHLCPSQAVAGTETGMTYSAVSQTNNNIHPKFDAAHFVKKTSLLSPSYDSGFVCNVQTFLWSWVQQHANWTGLPTCTSSLCWPQNWGCTKKHWSWSLFH